MSNVTALKPINPMPSDFPGILRELADRCERGEIGSFAGIYITDQVEFLWPSSLNDSIALAALMQHRAAQRFGL